jgi:hypothetical protein
MRCAVDFIGARLYEGTTFDSLQSRAALLARKSGSG